jgi:hypothetical protein
MISKIQVVLQVTKNRRAELMTELDTIDKFIALLQPVKHGSAQGTGANNGSSSARSEAMRRAWAKRKKAAADPVAVAKKKAPKKTVGASLADVA